MSTFLGRPGTINRSHGLPTPPVDAVIPKDPSSTPVIRRDPWKDAPTPLTGLLWLLQLNQPLFDIQDIEKDGPHPRDDFAQVDRIHRRIMETEEAKPAMFRLENPDTRWDDNPATFWVRILRYHFAILHNFNLMVLHRPYIFHRRRSREEALRASLRIMEVAGKMFDGLPPDHWRK